MLNDLKDKIVNYLKKKYRFFISLSFLIITSIFLFKYYELQDLEKFIVRQIGSYFFPGTDSSYENIDIKYNSLDSTEVKIKGYKAFIPAGDIVSIDNIETIISIKDILFGHLAPYITKINNIDLNVNILEKSNSDGKDSLNVKFIKAFSKTISDVEREFLHINNLNIKLHDKYFKLKDINSKISKSGNSFKIRTVALTEVLGNTYNNYMNIEYIKKQGFIIHLSLPRLPFGIIRNFYGYKIDEYIENDNIEFTPNITISADAKGKIDDICLYINELSGKVTAKKYFEYPIDIKKLDAELAYEFKTNSFNIRKLELITNDKINSNISLTGSIGKDYKLKFLYKNFDLKDIGKYWPSIVIPNIRNIVSNIFKNGILKEGEGEINISDKPISKNDIYFKLSVENAYIDYLRDLPHIKEANFIAKFDGEGVSFEIEKAKFLNTQVNSGKAYIPFIKNSYIELAGISKGKLNDHLAFATPFLSEEKKSDQIFKQLLEANIEASSSFNAKIPFNPEGFNDHLIIKSHIKPSNFSIKKYFNDIDIENIAAEFIFEYPKLHIKGNGKILSADLVFENFLDTKALKFNNNINLKLDQSNLSNWYKVFPELTKYISSGSINANIKYDSDNPNIYNYNIDASNTEVNINEIGYTKKSGVQLNAYGNINKENNKIILGNTKIKGPEYEVVGKLEFLDKKINAVDMKFISENNDFHISQLEKITKITGNKINLSNYLTKNTNKPIQESKNINFHINVKKALMANNIIFEDLLFDLACNDIKVPDEVIDRSPTNRYNRICTKLEFNANRFYGIKNENSKISFIPKNSIMFTSNNLGTLLKAHNLSKNFDGGTANIILDKWSKKNNSYSGKMKIYNLRALQNSFFFSLLKLTSISGILDIISQKNYEIDSILGIIEYNDDKDVLYLKDVVIKYGSISITMEGEIEILSNKIDLSGTIIPQLYGINKVTKHIPIIGIIGMNYSITNNLTSPQISVNPLSVLTPEFIRNLGKKSYTDNKNQE